MSVTSTSAAVSHTGNGVADTFTFTFKVFDETDLYINTYEIATGTLTLLALTTDYTVSLTDSGAGGGEVTLVAGPLAATHKIIIQRLLSYTQETNYVENDPFSAETLEDALDKCTMLIQQLKEELDRALLSSITTEAGVIAIGYDSGLPTIAAGDADKLVQVNAGTTAYELTSVSSAITATVNSLIAINTLTEKTTPISTDLIAIEDSSDGNSRKKVQLGNLGVGGNVDIFTSSDTWTKPASCNFVKVVCVGGGGGGGAGGSAVDATNSGGSGGGGGSRAERIFKASELTATVTVTIGDGGTAASAGGNTSFGSYLVAGGGGAGKNQAQGHDYSGGAGGGPWTAGQNAATDASNIGGGGILAHNGFGSVGGSGGYSASVGGPGYSSEYGGAGGGGTTRSKSGGNGGSSIFGGAGGGAGGAVAAGETAGGAGGARTSFTSGGGGTAGTAGNGGNGDDGDGYTTCGEGGGGGSSLTAGIGNGGNGGAWGGGGGGGGARSDNGTPGSGGTGGKGGCVVYTW